MTSRDQKRTGAPRARGVLDPFSARRFFDLSLAPATHFGLQAVVEHFWTVTWSLAAGTEHIQETLPHPCVHLVDEEGRMWVYGVPRGVYRRHLSGAGRAFGIKFLPGAFRSVWHESVTKLRGRRLPIAEVFPAAGPSMELALGRARSESERVATAERFLAELRPQIDDTVALARTAVNIIAGDRTVTRVDQVAVRLDVSSRTLERVFAEYVGVGPKWVIKRYRIIEAAERLAGSEGRNAGAIAAELGYFDQAHFVNDFRSITGSTPAAYARRSAASPESKRHPHGAAAFTPDVDTSPAPG